MIKIRDMYIDAKAFSFRVTCEDAEHGDGGPVVVEAHANGRLVHEFNGLEGYCLAAWLGRNSKDIMSEQEQIDAIDERQFQQSEV